MSVDTSTAHASVPGASLPTKALLPTLLILYFLCLSHRPGAHAEHLTLVSLETLYYVAHNTLDVLSRFRELIDKPFAFACISSIRQYHWLAL